MAKTKEIEVVTPEVTAPSEKEVLLSLYKTLQDRGIRSISDLENLINKAE